MARRIFTLILCALLFVSLFPAAVLAEEDYDVVTVQKGDTVVKLLKANGRDYDTDKYVVMVLNGFTREKQMETLTIGQTIKIPKAAADIQGTPPHLISNKDKVEYYVIPYAVQKGDTIKFVYKLWGLPYNDYADAIKALNPGVDLENIHAKDIIYLPTTEKNLKTNTFITVMSHEMLPNERIEEVVSRYGYVFELDREKLQTFNVKDFGSFTAGDKLLIPLQ